MRLAVWIFTVVFAAVSSGQETEPQEPVYRAWLEAGVAFPQTTELHSFLGTSKVKFNPGFRVGLGSGYDFTPYFALDWEIGVIGNSVSDLDAFLTQVPLLINATFQYQNQTGFRPFVGGGIGGASSAIDIDDIGSDYDFVFAWQAMAGVKYELRTGLNLGLLYKYLWTGDTQWDLEDERLEMDGMRTHSILGFVSYRF